MPPTRIPLFHPRVVRDRLAHHVFPADLGERRARLQKWIDTLRSGALDGAKEVQLHGQFLEQVFGGVLGYRGMVDAGGTAWEIDAEHTVSASGQSADGAIGWFREGESAVFAPIELKGARQSLDHAGNRPRTPVQQAWDYAQYAPGSRYVIVSNYRETRLYAKARTPDEYEVFQLEDLAGEEEFRRFYLLLARESLLPAEPPSEGGRFEARSLVDDLLLASSRREKEITRALYAEYRKLRRDLYTHLLHVHSNYPRRELLGHTQKILDRLLFIAFAVKRGLLPADTLEHALTHKDRYRKRPYWENLVAVFRFVDEGCADPRIPAYNGGLFRPDPELEELEVSDAMCGEFLHFARHDFREEISVEVLGHIFEQSIAEFEEMQAEAESESGDGEPPKLSKRKAEGVYYTPSFITRYLVEETLGRTLTERFAALLARIAPEKEKDGKKQTLKWIELWEAWQQELKRLRVLDPACGSGAFLIAAFDRLAREYDRVTASLASLRGGQAGLFDLTRTILHANLFGVDVNAESVEITKLSLWLKTAQYGKRLADLGRNIKWGNSVVDDVLVDPRAFDWQTGLPPSSLLDPPANVEEEEIDARWRDKFDVVIGNPPYVRQELLGKYKPHWQLKFRAYAGVADLYVYFFERGLHVLKHGGRLGFIVANKWLRAGYGEALRGLLAKETRIETFVDFGHAPIFPDADTFPCVITLRTQAPAADHEIEVTKFPREELRTTTIEEYAKANRFRVAQSGLGAGDWSLEPSEVEQLLGKIRGAGVPLVEYAGVKPYRGVVTGFNDAFLVDTATKDQLVRDDPASARILKRYLRGEDIDRWSAEWSGQWMIYVPWHFEIDAYPAVRAHLVRHKEGLEARPEVKLQRFPWFAMSRYAADYVELFDQPKILYQVIQFHPCYSLDETGRFVNDKGFFLPSRDAWLIAVLNSPLMWWHNWRYLPHMKDEALTPLGVKMEKLPIARPSDEQRDLAERIVPRLVEMTRASQAARRAMLDSLRHQFDIETAGQKLSEPASFDKDGFIAEVVARRGKKVKKLKAADVAALGDLFDETVEPMRQRAGEAARLERELSRAVNDAYGLTPAEVELMWKTAPPRMPVGR